LFSVSVTRRSEMYKLPIDTSRRAPAPRLCNARLCDSRKSSTIIFTFTGASLTALKASGGRSYVGERQGGNGGLFRRGPTDDRRTGVCRRHGRRHATPALGVLSRTDGATPGRAVACTHARGCAPVCTLPRRRRYCTLVCGPACAIHHSFTRVVPLSARPRRRRRRAGPGRRPAAPTERGCADSVVLVPDRRATRSPQSAPGSVVYRIEPETEKSNS